LGDLMRADISLSTGERGMTPGEVSDSLNRLNDFLTTHFRSTVMIFEHYAAGSHTGGKGSMDRGEFWKLIKDVNLQRNCSGADIDLIFQKSNLDNSIRDKSGGGSAGSNNVVDSELEGHEFVEAIIRLAVCKYKKTNTMDWETKFEQFYIKDLLPQAKQTNKVGFREEVLTDIQIKNVYKRNRVKLKRLFNHFSAMDTSNLNVSNAHTSSSMNVKELITMARQLDIMKPGMLTDTTVRTLFSQVQLSDGMEAEDDEEMNFEEFKEVLCAMAFIWLPNPWTPGHKKLKTFFSDIFAAASDILG